MPGRSREDYGAFCKRFLFRLPIGCLCWLRAAWGSSSCGTTRWPSPSFALSDLLLPLVVLLLVLIVLHALIALVLPLRWLAIRGEYEKQLRVRLAADMDETFGEVPGEVAEALVGERMDVQKFMGEVREISGWLEQKEEAASIVGLHGKE